jgi:Peptidase A4 family
MRGTRLGILGVLTLLPALAQVPYVMPAGQIEERLAPHQFGPVRDLLEHDNGTAESTNWSGYAVLGPSFTSVAGSWIVPSATCTKGDQYAAFWVGLDGYNANSQTVEQTGTMSYCQGSQALYYAWYELYPNPSYEITAVVVNPGDVISASVTHSGNKFTVTLDDQTSKQTYTKAFTLTGPKRNSAEWIVEAPCCTNSGGILPLADFGTGYFGYDYTFVTGTNDAIDQTISGPIPSWPQGDLKEINKVSSSTSPQTSTCSVLSTDGTGSFTCAWAK